MAYPDGWPPRRGSNRSLLFYQNGTGTANFSDNAWLFPILTEPLPYLKPGSTDTIAVGNQTTAVGVPMGGGRAKEDKNTSTSDPALQPPPVPHGCSRGIYICNVGASNRLEFSFDNGNVHGVVLPEKDITFTDMYHGGISVRGVTEFIIIAW